MYHPQKFSIFVGPDLAVDIFFGGVRKFPSVGGVAYSAGVVREFGVVVPG